MRSTSCVYIIGSADRDRPIKVGLTRDCPRRRLKILQTGSPEVLVLKDFIEIPPWLVMHVEQRAHQALWEFHIHGEWFNADVETARAAILVAVAFLEENPPPRKRPIVPERDPAVPRKMVISARRAARKAAASAIKTKPPPKPKPPKPKRVPRPPPVKRTEWMPNLHIGPNGRLAESWDEIRAWRAAGRPSAARKGNDND